MLRAAVARRRRRRLLRREQAVQQDASGHADVQAVHQPAVGAGPCASVNLQAGRVRVAGGLDSGCGSCLLSPREEDGSPCRVP